MDEIVRVLGSVDRQWAQFPRLGQRLMGLFHLVLKMGKRPPPPPFPCSWGAPKAAILHGGWLLHCDAWSDPRWELHTVSCWACLFLFSLPRQIVLVPFLVLKFCLFSYLFLTTSGLSCGTWDLLSRCAGFSLVVCRLSCPTAHGILVPGPGIEPASPASAGGFLTTGPPGKSQLISKDFSNSIVFSLNVPVSVIFPSWVFRTNAHRAPHPVILLSPWASSSPASARAVSSGRSYFFISFLLVMFSF